MDATRSLQISVIGAGEPPPEAIPLAEEVGRELARRGAIVVTGGLAGIMEAVCRGAKEAGGTTIGILPGTDPARRQPLRGHHHLHRHRLRAELGRGAQRPRSHRRIRRIRHPIRDSTRAGRRHPRHRPQHLDDFAQRRGRHLDRSRLRPRGRRRQGHSGRRVAGTSPQPPGREYR